VNGTGFFPAAASEGGATVFRAAFSCTFPAAPGRIHTQYAAMTFVSGTQLRGSIPVWKERACAANFTLLLGVENVYASVLHVGTPGSPSVELLTHAFLPAFAGFQNPKGSTKGGSEMIVSGYALPQEGNYECRFIGVSGVVAYPDCECNTGCSVYKCVKGVWASPTRITCLVPKWPAAGTANITLLRDGAVLPSANAEAGFDSSGVFRYVTEYWERLSTTNIYVVPDAPLVLSGNLRNNTGYSCLMVRDRGENYLGVPEYLLPSNRSEHKLFVLGEGAVYRSYGPRYSNSPGSTAFIKDSIIGEDEAFSFPATVTCNELAHNFRGSEQVVDVLMVASAGTADEEVVINAKGVSCVFVEALVGGFDTSHSDAGGGEAWRGGRGRVGIPANSSASYAILVTGNGFVTRQEELFHATNLLVSGQPPPSFTRGYACSLCFVRAREGGSPVVGLCPSAALQMEAEVMNSSVLSCRIASSAALAPLPSATPHLRLSISRVDMPYEEPGGRVGMGGGGWGDLKGSQVSSCPDHLQDVGVGGGEGVGRCLRGGYPLGISLALVGHVTKISPTLLPTVGGVAVTVEGDGFYTTNNSNISHHCIFASSHTSSLLHTLGHSDTDVHLSTAVGLPPGAPSSTVALKIEDELLLVVNVSTRTHLRVRRHHLHTSATTTNGTYAAGTDVWPVLTLAAEKSVGGGGGGGERDGGNVLKCGEHTWPFASVKAGLSILQVQVPFASRQLLMQQSTGELLYLHSSWRSDLVNTNGSAGGGDVLLLQGSNLCHASPGEGGEGEGARGENCSSRSYACMWQSEENPLSNVSAAADIVSSSTLRCTTPPWPFASAKTQVLVLDRSDGAPVKHLPSYTATASYTFLADVRNVSTALGVTKGGSVPRLIAIGNAHVSISGAGFDAQLSYTCVVRAKKANMDPVKLTSYPASVTSPSSVTCTFAPLPANVGAQVAPVFLEQANRVVTCCGRPGCVCDLGLEYVESWSKTSHSVGQEYLYIEGAGFNVAASYACHFFAAADASVNRTTVPNAPLSTARLACQLPGYGEVPALGSYTGNLFYCL